MKTLFAAVACSALLLPGLALAQTPSASGQSVSATRNLNGATGNTGVAAATLPDSFAPPAARAPARPAPATAPVVQSEPSSPEVIAATEAALTATIAAAQSGTMNYDDMTPGLAEQVRSRSATLTPIIQGFGAMKSVEHRGRENGAELFLVTFENAVTQWIVGLGPEDKIAALLFRPAPEA